MSQFPAHAPAPRPWYREPWPWLLALGPLAVVIGGAVTFWLAAASNDGLVATDYYRRGLAINKTLARQQTAVRMQYSAQLSFGEDGRSVRVKMSGSGQLPSSLQLRLAHPTRAGLDEVIVLRAVQAGEFAASLGVPIAGRRLLVLEDAAQTWQLTGEAAEVAGATVALTAGQG
jgi:uncharacterized protein